MGNSVTRFAKFAAFIVMSIAATESHGLAQSKSGRIDKLITLYHKYGQFNGVVLVAQRGQVVYEHAFGQSNFELDSPNTVDTKFEIASITKPMTALLIMQLVEDGKVSLHRRVSDYVSYYPRETGDRISTSLYSYTGSRFDRYVAQLSFFARRLAINS